MRLGRSAPCSVVLSDVNTPYPRNNCPDWLSLRRPRLSRRNESHRRQVLRRRDRRPAHRHPPLLGTRPTGPASGAGSAPRDRQDQRLRHRRLPSSAYRIGRHTTRAGTARRQPSTVSSAAAAYPCRRPQPSPRFVKPVDDASRPHRVMRRTPRPAARPRPRAPVHGPGRPTPDPGRRTPAPARRHRRPPRTPCPAGCHRSAL
jgi:hypothetical protein